MATKKKTPTPLAPEETDPNESAFALAAFQWAQRVHKANMDLAESMETFGGKPSSDPKEEERQVNEEWRQIRAIAEWLSCVVSSACFDEPHGTGSALTDVGLREVQFPKRFAVKQRDRQILRRVFRASRPPLTARDNGEAIELAVHCIKNYARTFPDVRPEQRVNHAVQMATGLGGCVESAFYELVKHPEAVMDLLGRYTESKDRNRGGRTAGVPSGITSAGILCEVNALVAFPLGRLTPNGVLQAIKRLTKKRP